LLKEETMLVLNRKTNESIVLEGGVTITVLSVAGGKVRFGLNAPDEVPIVRGELSFWLERTNLNESSTESEP
jgi:carbon storage regulator